MYYKFLRGTAVIIRERPYLCKYVPGSDRDDPEYECLELDPEGGTPGKRWTIKNYKLSALAADHFISMYDRCLIAGPG